MQNLLKEAAHRSGKPFKVTLNDAIRAGLRPQRVAQADAPAWPVFDMGQPLVDLSKAMALADELDAGFPEALNTRRHPAAAADGRAGTGSDAGLAGATGPASLFSPSPSMWPYWESLLLGAGRGGPLASDAHRATLAIEHGATISSFDADFARLAGLRFSQLR